MFVRARPTGFWIFGSVVDPLEFEGVDEDRSNALDGKNGGSYTLLTALNLGGEGLTLSGAKHHVAGTLTVDNLGLIKIASGGTVRADGSTSDIELKVVSNVAKLTVGNTSIVEISGALNMLANGLIAVDNAGGIALASGAELLAQSGAVVQVDAGADVTIAASVDLTGQIQVQSGGDITALSGAQLTVSSGATASLQGTTSVSGTMSLIGSNNWIQLATARDWDRAASRIRPLTYAQNSGTGPSDPDVWEAKSDINPPAPCWRTSVMTTSGAQSVIEFEDLPQGGTIEGAIVTCKGTISIDNNTLPTYRIVRWKDSAAAGYTNVSDLKTDDGHDDDDFAFVVGVTTIVANANQTIDKQYRYGILVSHPYHASTQGMRVYDAHLYGTFAALKN